MGAACFRHSTETGQTIGINGAASSQVLAGLLLNGFELETRHRAELDAQRVPLITDPKKRSSLYVIFH
jgi:hypothetical protein